MTCAMALPQGFEALEPFVEEWSSATAFGRDLRRSQSSAQERQAFFDAAAPLLQRALDHLDAKPLVQLDASEKVLLNMMLSLGHIQMAVEVHRETEPQHAAARQAMTITRSVTDLA